jgi:hypothetical protein
MALNSLAIAWLIRAHQKLGRDYKSMLELGPQEVHATLGSIRKALGDEYFLQEGSRQHARHKHPWLQVPIYAHIFGLERYYSLDSLDPSATFCQDLNSSRLVLLPHGPFDLISNFGTSEHIFDIAATFEFSVNNLSPGGALLFGLPSFGDIGHGFYNVHPTLFFDLAVANGLEIVDFTYFDNMGVRSSDYQRTFSFDFESLPLKVNFSDLTRSFDELNPSFAALVELQFFKNISIKGERFLEDLKSGRLTFDMIFAVLRKPDGFLNANSGFNVPIQSLYQDFPFEHVQVHNAKVFSRE